MTKPNKYQPRTTSRVVQLRVKATGEDELPLKVLGVLFKEVLEVIPPALAKTLSEAYRKGKVIHFAIADSAYGVTRKTAFQCNITEDNRLQQTRGIA